MRRHPIPVVALLLAGLCGACEKDPLVGYDPGPAFHLVLSKEPPLPPPGLPGDPPVVIDSGIYGLFKTVGSAVYADYLPVDAVTLTRTGDGALFDLREIVRTGAIETGDRFTYLVTQGNLHIPWSGQGGRLGRDAMAGGETLELMIAAGGRIITGSVTIPPTPVITVIEEGDEVTMHWAPVAGAVLYAVSADTDVMWWIGSLLTTDTSYRIRRDRPTGGLPFVPPSPPLFTVVALEANYAAFLQDTLRLRAGITGANGLLGASSRAQVPIPEP